MNVEELINELNSIKDKTKPVYAFYDDEIYPIESVDTTISDRVDINLVGCALYFKKYWEGIKMEVQAVTGTTYYVEVYPFDVYENDTMCIRVYTDKEMTKENECGNGLWCDSSFGWVDGNDELYFEEDSSDDSIVENEIVNAVQSRLVEEGIL